MKNCIMLWKNDDVDLAINNQRRAFADAYNIEVLAESKIYIELTSKNPLSKLSSLETEDLKNMFKAVAEKYAVGPLFIKTHPRDTTDYAALFPDAVILERTMPSEV